MSEHATQPEDVLRIEFASLTDIGLFRQHNEDHFGEPTTGYADKLASRGYLFAVADGMGGHALGELASHLAIDTLFSVYYKADADPVTSLRAGIEAANAAVFYQGGLRGVSMGTTLVAILLHQSMLTLANVGDSRIYRFRGTHVQQLTHDHSLVAEQVRRGLITEEQARHSQARNIITRSIGHRLPAEMDIIESPLVADDVLLLCSDGLHNLVEATEMATVIADHPIEEVPRALIDLANERGGTDNITCLVVRIRACPPPDQNDPPVDEEAAAE